MVRLDGRAGVEFVGVVKDCLKDEVEAEGVVRESRGGGTGARVEGVANVSLGGE